MWNLFPVPSWLFSLEIWMTTALDYALVELLILFVGLVFVFFLSHWSNIRWKILYRVIHFVVSKVNVNKTHIKYFFFMICLFYYKVWTLTLDIMCETLHHLNDHHANRCKHRFFRINFRPLFDTYWAVSQP